MKARTCLSRRSAGRWCLAAATVFVASGCGKVLDPAGTFATGCPSLPDVGLSPSALAGTWTGTVSVTKTNASGDTTTSDQPITVTFDEFGRPVGNTSPWPSEWPGCVVAGAKLERIETACDDPMRFPQQQNEDTIWITEAEFTDTRFRLVWHHSISRATCPEGHEPPQWVERAYEGSVEGAVLNWSARFTESGQSWQGSPREVVTEITGRLTRQGE